MNNYKPGWKNPNWFYVPARHTNILESFKRLGWHAPSQLRVSPNPSAVDD